MTITSERVEELREMASQCRRDVLVRSITARMTIGELLALLDAYEDQHTKSIHTCHDHCQRTECVLRRDLDALVEGVREFVAKWNKAADAAEQEWRQIEAQHPTSLGPLPCDVATNARMMCDDLTALLARVEGERHG